MSMTTWAENEVRLACSRENPDRKDGEFDYGCACYESALKAFKCLMEDGHTGMSISLTKGILNRLIDGIPLTPIEDVDENWNYLHTSDDGIEHHQSIRMYSLFKSVHPDGSVTYSDSRTRVCVDVDSNSLFHNGFIISIIDEMFPIKMPYYPSEKIYVYCTDCLTDSRNGDFDTLAILYVVKGGDRINVGRYFKATYDSYCEISKDEYDERVRIAGELKQGDKK